MSADAMEHGAGTAAQTRWPRTRGVVAATLFVCAALLIGFAVFDIAVRAYHIPDTSARADGIVVFTGGRARLDPAVGLLRNKRGQKLMISGVHEQTSAETLRHLLHVDPSLFNCCVTIDRLALDTIGNANSAVDFARQNGFESLIVVTNDYHMPRSLLEIRRVADDLTIIPFPVSNSARKAQSWSLVIDRYRVLAGEYTKLLLAYGRAPFTQSSARAASLSGW
ncbi:MAG: YdcF family protein [Pseudomonadota bacterium]